jgi:hypothetical protein
MRPRTRALPLHFRLAANPKRRVALDPSTNNLARHGSDSRDQEEDYKKAKGKKSGAANAVQSGRAAYDSATLRIEARKRNLDLCLLP